MTNDVPAFARSPLGGKKNSTVTIRMTDEQKSDVDQAARRLGMSTSEFIEKLVAISIYGLDEVVEAERHRANSVAGWLKDLLRKGSN